jgi:radical SAM protein with 4Fe4S-binding SPASM domain
LIDKERARRLVLSRFGLITISIDGAKRETYEKIRRGADFDRLILNIKRINFFKRGYRIERPKLRFHFVAMRENIEELPLLIELAHSLNVEEVSVAYVGVYFKELEEQSLYFYKELSDRIMVSSKEKGEAVGIKVTLPPLFKDGRGGERGRSVCKWPWGYMVVSVDGMVHPCCASSMEMGDLRKDDFRMIWNNERYQELRRKVNTDRPPPECKRCGHHFTLDPNNPKAHFRYME